MYFKNKYEKLKVLIINCEANSPFISPGIQKSDIFFQEFKSDFIWFIGCKNLF